MKHITILVVLVIASEVGWSQDNLFEYEKVPKESGFKMNGYWVWGGSIIKVDSTYHLFASRWPKGEAFPLGYMNHSEIVRAASKSALGPFRFQEIVIGERDSSYWDSNMAHNPTIHKINNRYVLFYIGSNFTKQDGWPPFHRTIGYATSENINGPWLRSEKPIITRESNNPAVFVEKNGNIKMMFRSADLRISMATSQSYSEPFTIVNDNAWPQCRLEDFYLFKFSSQYHCICEDNAGKVSGHERWGIHLYSNDGIKDWNEYDPVVIYNHEFKYEDGTIQHCIRRERPQLLITEGEITHLINGVYDGKDSWCQPVQLKRFIKID